MIGWLQVSPALKPCRIAPAGGNGCGRICLKNREKTVTPLRDEKINVEKTNYYEAIGLHSH
jgi:hypothetical protein